MRSLDIVQEGDPVLVEIAQPFELPAEAQDAWRVVAKLLSALERVAQVHNFTKGIDLAALQINDGRSLVVSLYFQGASP
jgi:peptide deformylase